MLATADQRDSTKARVLQRLPSTAQVGEIVPRSTGCHVV